MIVTVTGVAETMPMGKLAVNVMDCVSVTLPEPIVMTVLLGLNPLVSTIVIVGVLAIRYPTPTAPPKVNVVESPIAGLFLAIKMAIVFDVCPASIVILDDKLV